MRAVRGGWMLNDRNIRVNFAKFNIYLCGSNANFCFNFYRNLFNANKIVQATKYEQNISRDQLQEIFCKFGPIKSVSASLLPTK